MSAALAKHARTMRARAEAVARLAALLALAEPLPAASPCLGDARSVGYTYEIWPYELAVCLCGEPGIAHASAWHTQLASTWRTAVYDADERTLEACTEAVVAALLPLVPASVHALQQRCRDGPMRLQPLMEHAVAALYAATRTLPTVP